MVKDWKIVSLAEFVLCSLIKMAASDANGQRLMPTDFVPRACVTSVASFLCCGVKVRGSRVCKVRSRCAKSEARRNTTLARSQSPGPWYFHHVAKAVTVTTHPNHLPKKQIRVHRSSHLSATYATDDNYSTINRRSSVHSKFSLQPFLEAG